MEINPLDYEGLRTFIRNIYEALYTEFIPALTDLCRWFFLPVGTALREGADRLAIDPTLSSNIINRVIEFVANTAFNDMPLAVVMLGNAVIVFLTFQVAKFVLDIIF